MAKNAKLQFIFTMLIFGSVGIFRRYIDASSVFIAIVRGLIGSAFLIVLAIVTKRKLRLGIGAKYTALVIISGALIGSNWILLFESFNYTSVATATLCYYMQPVFVIIASPILLGERLGRKKVICVITALIGMIFVSGVLETGFSDVSEIRGVLLALGAALLYSGVVLINKKLPDTDVYAKTVVQLAAASILLLPYLFITGSGSLAMDTRSIIMLLILGIVHTGFTYMIYFDALAKIPAQSAAIYGYLDPVTAVILSAIILRERLTALGIIGAALIIGSLIVSDLNPKKKIA